MALTIDTLVLGPLETNTYVLRSGDVCWVVDPAFPADPLIELLRRHAIVPEKILLTHGHGDHIGGVPAVTKYAPLVRLLCPSGDAGMLCDAQNNLSALYGVPIVAREADELLWPGQDLLLGDDVRIRVLDTSGHTPGSVSFYCEAENVVFTGDSLFAGSVGRTDLPGASEEAEIRNIRRNLLTLPDITRALPGHGPETLIGMERLHNPFFEK
jgi:glyoxylase-like metal-dependent hydrolase (beta-lactamase superfamily II)